MSDTNGKPSILARIDKRVLIAAGVVLAVLLVAGGIALARRGGSSAGGGTAGNGETTSTATSTVAATGTPLPKPVRPGTTSPKTLKPGTTTKPGTGKQPALQTARPKDPAADGSKLTTITAPPEKTLALLDPKKVPADAVFSLEFSPFGYAPSGANAPKRLVIRITKATQTGGKDTDLALKDSNMLVILNSDVKVTIGGSYKGQLSFQSQGSVLVPTLDKVSALK